MNALRTPRSLFAALALLALPASAGCRGGAKSAVDWKTQVPYQHGTALAHVPSQCAGGTLYVDLQAVLKSEGTAEAAELVSEKLANDIGDTPGDRATLRVLGESLKEQGLDPLRDTSEIALCFRGDDQGLVVTLGGAYSGKDLFGAFARAAERRHEEPPPVQSASGVPYLALGKIMVARPAANVIVLTEDPTVLPALKTPAPRATQWGVQPNEIVVAHYGGKEPFELSVVPAGSDLEITGHFGFPESQTSLEGIRDRAAVRLEDTPMAMLAVPVRDTTVTVEGGRATVTLRASSKLLAQAIQRGADLPPGEMKRILGFILAPESGEQKI